MTFRLDVLLFENYPCTPYIPYFIFDKKELGGELIMTEKVAIIGGGLSGLCSALALQQQGIDAEVYDHNHLVNWKDSGMILGGNALKALEFLGLKSKLKEIGFPSDNCKIYSETGTEIANFTYPSSTTKFLFVHATDIQNLLIKSLKPGTVHHEKTLVQLINNKDQLALFFQDGTSTSTDYMIACDGEHSFVRSHLLPETYVHPSRFFIWEGIIDAESEFNSLEYSETWGPRGVFGIAPLPKRKLFWYAIKKCSLDDHIESWNSIDLLFNFFSYHEPIQAILERASNQPIKPKELNRLEPLSKYLFGKILLLGDSAHMLPPNLGQGSSLAIEDAYILANRIQTSRTILDAFRRYERDRLIRSKRMSIDLIRLQALSQIDKPALCSIRDKLLKLIPSSYHQNKLKTIFEIDPVWK